MTDDRFESDLRAVVQETIPREAPASLRERVGSVTEQPTAERPSFRLVVRWAAYVVVGVVAIVIATFAFGQRQPIGPSPSPGMTSPGEKLVRLELGGLSLEHPANWTYHEYPFVASFFDVIGYLTTGPFDPESVCTGTNNGVHCNFSGNPVEAGGVGVKFVHWQPPLQGVEAEAGEELMTVGGMPAQFAGSSSDGILTLTWRVRQPKAPNGWYEIEARIREPGIEVLRRQVEAMIDSLEFDPPPTILPQSGPEFDRQAAFAARQALASLRNEQYAEAYACFDDELGVPRRAKVDMSIQGPLSQPLEVTCTTSVAADVDVWRVRLVMAWAAGEDYAAGRQETEVWVSAAGDAGGQSGSGDQAPYAICPPACG